MDGQTTQLVPEWTAEDFMTERPYAWLYAQKDNKFLLQILLNKMQITAKEVGFAGFIKTWNAYVESKSPKATILGNNQTVFPDQPVQLQCGQYVADEFGVSRVNEMGVEIEVTSHPIMPVKRVTNIETLEEKLEIAYSRGIHKAGKPIWKSIVVGREQLASAQKIIGLAKQGIAINSENAKEVVKYLGQIESLNYNELPVQNAVSHMGWLNDGRFMPYVDDIAYDGESVEFDKIYRELKPTGDEETWMRICKQVRNGDSVPCRMALAASFAAPLVRVLDALPFFVHLWGDKGCGKSVGLMLAASVWGNPEFGGLAKTFSGTRVSMELYAAFCCNLPLLFDELQVVNDNRRSFDDIIYMLCEGVSKGRGAKDGGLQLQKRWSTTIITTGETPIIQSNSGGGATVRTIEVNFRGQPLFGDDKRAREVAGLLKENYGFAGQKFIDAISQPGVRDSLKRIQKRYYEELEGDIDGKQILSASILLTADKLADVALFHDGKNLTADEVKEFLVTKSEADVERRCYEFIRGWIASNPRRFDSENDNNGELWGKIEGDTVFIVRKVFESALSSNGFNTGSFLSWAKRHRLLDFENYGTGNKNNRLTCRKRFNGILTTCVGLYVGEDGKGDVGSVQDDGYTIVEDDGMPF